MSAHSDGGAATGRAAERRRRMQQAFARSRVGTWIALNVTPWIDRRLLRATRGRLSSFAGTPVGLLAVRGARSGVERRIPLVFTTDGGRIVLVASKGGSPTHPAWYHNCVANPDVQFTAAGRTRRYTARVTTPAERAELWPRVNDVYAGYDVYQLRASDRTIPLVVLDPP